MNRSSRFDRWFRRHLLAFVRDVAGAIAGRADALHRTRVASRRLREALPIVGAALPGGKIRRTRRRVRRVTRVLGPVRELDVALALVDERARARPSLRAAVDRVRQHIGGERERRRERMLARLTPGRIETLRRRLEAFTRAIAEAGRPNTWRARLAARITRRAGRVRLAVDRAGALYVPERVHAVRVAVKQLRYTLELTGESAVVHTTDAVRHLKRLQNTLGRLHDLEILLRHAQAVQAAVDPREPWAPDLEALVRGLEDECRRRHGKYLAERATLLKICAAAADVASRLWPGRGRAASRRQLKMSLEPKAMASRPRRAR